MPQENELPRRPVELGLTFDQLQGAELPCFDLFARKIQMLEVKLRDKVAGSLLGGSIEEDSHICLGTGRTRGLVAHVRARTGGVRFRCPGEGFSRCQGASKTPLRTSRGAKLQEEKAGAPSAGGQKK